LEPTLRHWPWEEDQAEVRAFPHKLTVALHSLIGEVPRSAIDEAGSPR
jgi:hypothetical protein